ncbi:MAG: hypothetical protein QXG65_03510 [Thermoplasmata archaeon]
MTLTQLSRFAVSALTGFVGGSVSIEIGTASFLSVDARSRNIDLQIAPFLRGQVPLRTVLRVDGPSDLWAARRTAADLARKGWRIAFCEGSNELLVIGRGTSPWTGRIRTSPIGLWKMRRLGYELIRAMFAAA